MNPAELLARASSIWIGLALYVAGEIGRPRWRERAPAVMPLRFARWAATLGLGFYLLHVASAFGSFHAWSHQDAYAFTARETEALVGVSWGGGLYINYAFTLVWLLEIMAWWCAPQRYQLRARPESDLRSDEERQTQRTLLPGSERQRHKGHRQHREPEDP